MKTMISKDRLLEAEKKYPLPKLCKWYLNDFPKGAFQIAMIILFLVGFVMTIAGMSKILIAIPTYSFCTGLLVVSPIHIIAWIQKRNTFKKRADFLGVDFDTYNQSI